ncbi:hypothetical protein GCM10009801_49790 [Streptomyces albiaxialis]|uniref:Uncharacterized protein n=1 Tax=Streptomyces albiaxialis TaxID=329523 RepID=A0ABN2W9U8_9ACTN
MTDTRARDGSAIVLENLGLNNNYSPVARTTSWSGTAGAFGFVTLAYPTERRSDGTTVVVSGASVPYATCSAFEYGGRALSSWSEFSVDGHWVKVSRRRLAVTRRGRSLRLRVAGRRYRYGQAGSLLRHELSRDGATVVMERSSWSDPATLSGGWRGEADGMDVALALLLEGVYTRHLSLAGALVSLPGRFLSAVGSLG